jgi:predicted dehydrogenase
VGVIGCGWIGQNVHIPSYIEDPKAKLVAISDQNQERLLKVSTKYSIEHHFSDYHEMLESNLVDAVSICTPTSSHAEIAIEAAKNGIHTLCEKPLASNLYEAKKIEKAVNKSKIKFMVGFNLRFLPNHVITKQFIDKGKIGKPLFILAEVIAPGPYTDKTSDQNYRFEADKRMGVFMDIGSHIIDLFIWMIGKPRKVSAAFSTYHNNVNVDDMANISVRFVSNVLGNISVAWLSLPDYQATADSRMIKIIGTHGQINSEFLGPSIMFYSKNSLTSKIKGKIKMTPVKFNPKIPDEALNWSYKKEIDNFLESIIKDKVPSITLNHATNVLKVIHSAYKSSKLHSEVSIR